MDIFWINDPSILIKDYYEILPRSNMTRIKQMNTATRFLIYLILLCIIFNSGGQMVIYGLIAILLIVVFYLIYSKDEVGIQKDLINENSDPLEMFTLNTCNDCEDDSKKILNGPMIDVYDKAKDYILKGTGKSDKNIIFESGYIDSDGNYKIGKNYADIDITQWKKEQENLNKKISWDKNQVYNKATCRKPTVDNPFTNIVFTDYLDASNVAEPCNSDDQAIQTDMQNLYNSTIYRNVDDVFERENSQRMFYTVPIRTIPNDQTNFANWLYKTGPTCKENSQNCTYYEIPTMTSQRY